MGGTRAGALERASGWATRATGTSVAFALAVGVIVVWLVTGPLFHFSDTWQLVINTGTTIVTFLMVFLIQRGQNKESMAIQLKLNELVAAVKGASNRLINVEELTEAEVCVLHEHYRTLVELAKQDEKLTDSHSIEDARYDHAEKLAARRRGVGNEDHHPRRAGPELEPAGGVGHAFQAALGLVPALVHPQVPDRLAERDRVGAEREDDRHLAEPQVAERHQPDTDVELAAADLLDEPADPALEPADERPHAPGHVEREHDVRGPPRGCGIDLHVDRRVGGQ